jgi:hypothetical protein
VETRRIVNARRTFDEREDRMTSPPSEPDRTPPATPTWVKVVGAIAVLLIVIVVIALLAGGEHGPGRHVSTGETTTMAHALPQPR